jgi:tetratricopeptide (TPR) repeat protein
MLTPGLQWSLGAPGVADWDGRALAGTRAGGPLTLSAGYRPFLEQAAAATAEVRLDDGRSGWVDDVVMEDEDLDLALVCCVIHSPKPPPFLSIAERPELPIGEKVYAIGNPQRLEGSLSEGIISGRRETTTGICRLQTTAPISPGSSGGPLLDSAGQVVGVVQATMRGGQNLNFVIPVSQVIAFLEGPCNTRELWRGRGIREEEEHAYRDALASTALPVSKSDIGVVLRRAHNHIRFREYEEATHLLANAVPGHAGEHEYLLYYTIGVSAMGRATDQIWGNFTTVHDMYGRYRSNRDYQLAIKSVAKSIELNPQFSPAYERLAVYLSYAGQFREALKYADVLVARVPRCATAYKLRARLHSELDRDLAAYTDLSTALELAPGDPETHFYFGNACVSMAEYAKAVEAYKDALALFDGDPSYTPDCYYSIGNALKRSGQYEKALPYYERSKELRFCAQWCDEGIAECRRRLRGQPP